MKNLLIIILSVFSILVSSPVVAEKLDEKGKIEYLLKAIGGSGLVFIRNGEEHLASEAEEHLRMKLKKAGDKIKTADDFINNIASKSSMTMKPYYIKLKDGTLVEAEKWLHNKLDSIKE